MIVLFLSILFQLSAAFYAIWLIRVTGLKYSWIFISTALFLMAVRRIIPLYHLITDAGYTADFNNEIFGLSLSFLMLLGVRKIRPVFLESRAAVQSRVLLKEKELILKEVHHRIKNNMSTVKSLLSLQAVKSGEPLVAAALRDAGNRVDSMMVLYDILYRSEGYSEMSARAFISGLIDQIVSNFPYSENIKIEKNIAEFSASTKKLSTLGILINEVLTNIMKHSFDDGDGGTINVSLYLLDEHIKLEVADNGRGIPADVDIENTPGFGLVLVGMLAKQMEGEVRIERENGTKIIVEFDR